MRDQRKAKLLTEQDASPEAERVLIELTRRMTTWQRIEQASALTCACRALILSDLRLRYPHATDTEIRARLAARTLPREDVIRAYGWDPLEKGF